MNKSTRINQKSKILFALFFVVSILVISLFLIIFNPDIVNWSKYFDKQDQNDENPPAYSNLTMTVDFGNSTINIFQNMTMQDNSSTVFDLLNIPYEITYDSYVNGKLVTGINGVLNNPTQNLFWFYWVNDEYANSASSSIKLNSGDKILWNYTTNQF